MSKIEQKITNYGHKNSRVICGASFKICLRSSSGGRRNGVGGGGGSKSGFYLEISKIKK